MGSTEKHLNEIRQSLPNEIANIKAISIQAHLFLVSIYRMESLKARNGNCKNILAVSDHS